MREYLSLIFKGFIVGLGKIIPGVSGAMLAMIMDIYEPVLSAIANLKKSFYKNIKFLSFLGIGIIIAIIFGSNILLFLLKRYYLQTMFLFIGVIFCSMLSMMKKLRKTSIKDKIISLFIVLLFSLLPLLKLNVPNTFFNNVFGYFISGLLDAFASIVPGVSGTVMLMLVGTYNNILNAFATILNFNFIVDNIRILFPFFVGILIGAYFISKFVSYAFKKYPNISNNCIVGLIIGSLIMLVFKIEIINYSIVEIIISLIFFIIGFLLVKIMNI